MNDSGDAGQCSKLVCCGEGGSVCDASEKGGFADGGEADHADTSITESADLEALALATLCAGLKKLRSILSEFGLKLTDVVLSRLVLLRTSDLLLNFSDLFSHTHI